MNNKYIEMEKYIIEISDDDDDVDVVLQPKKYVPTKSKNKKKVNKNRKRNNVKDVVNVDESKIFEMQQLIVTQQEKIDMLCKSLETRVEKQNVISKCRSSGCTLLATIGYSHCKKCYTKYIAKKNNMKIDICVDCNERSPANGYIHCNICHNKYLSKRFVNQTYTKCVQCNIRSPIVGDMYCTICHRRYLFEKYLQIADLDDQIDELSGNVVNTHDKPNCFESSTLMITPEMLMSDIPITFTSNVSESSSCEISKLRASAKPFIPPNRLLNYLGNQ